MSMSKVEFNHVGVGVADIHAGVDFYQSVLDCRVIRPASEVTAEGEGGDEAVDVLGPPRFHRMMIAHLAMPNEAGIELFQLIDPPHEPRNPRLEYWKSGVFHFSITDPNLEQRLELLMEHGGKQLSKIWINMPPDKKMVYCCDPWGTIIEIYSHNFIDMYS
jgi:catechol 2,3-dioxygenase-like lactoylglutathione lyase family enzyme